MVYPALLERALRLVEAKGGTAAESELCTELFGSAAGPWTRMLAQVLDADGRLRRTVDGVWSARRAIAEARAGYNAGSTVGLVVLAAGPKPWRHPIVAIGAAREGARFETLVRPEMPCRVPRYLEKLGVRADDLEEAPSLQDALGRLVDFVGAARLTGLDIGVAVARLQFALRSVGRAPLDNAIAELATGEDVKPDLAALARRYDLPVPARLSAGSLAELALRLDCTLDTHKAGSALGSTAWRRLLDARLLASIPASPGIYSFRDRPGRLLYIGKATSLRERLASYLTGQFALVRRMPGLVEATHTLEHESLSCELEARIREAELIAQYRPTYNVQRRLEPTLAWAGLDISSTSRLKLRLAAEPFEGALLGPVTAARAAFRRVLTAWFPARARRNARPDADAISERLARLAGIFAADIRATSVAPGLTAADLTGGLRVVAPVRPPRHAPAEPEDDGWSRERFDATWPPRELLEVVEASDIDATGTPHVVATDTVAEVVVGPGRLVALSVVLAALRRAEPGVSAEPP